MNEQRKGSMLCVFELLIWEVVETVIESLSFWLLLALDSKYGSIFASCGTLSNLLTLSELQFSHL